MGATFTANIDSNNIVTITQIQQISLFENDIKSVDNISINLSDLINKYGFITIEFRKLQIKNYIMEKYKNNINLLNKTSSNLTPNIIDDIFTISSYEHLIFINLIDKYLLIPIIPPQSTPPPGEIPDYKLLLPNFILDSTKLSDLSNLIKKINPSFNEVDIIKYKNILSNIQKSPNPKLHFINLLASCVVLEISLAIRLFQLKYFLSTNNIQSYIPNQGTGDNIPNQGTGDYIPNQGTGGNIPNQGTGGYIPNQGTGDYIPNQGTGGNIPNQDGPSYNLLLYNTITEDDNKILNYVNSDLIDDLFNITINNNCEISNKILIYNNICSNTLTNTNSSNKCPDIISSNTVTNKNSSTTIDKLVIYILVSIIIILVIYVLYIKIKPN